MIRTLAAIALAAIATLAPASAQEDDSAFDFAGDAYRAGGAVAFEDAGARDAFLAGESVRLGAAISGSAHLVGRRVESDGAVGRDLYAAGGSVRVAGPVTGAASLVGYDVIVTGDIGGNLRAAGTQVDLSGPVAGGAMLTGSSVTIASSIAGDAAVAAEDLAFGDGARIGGRLTLFEAEGEPHTVPDTVIPADRIDRRIVAQGRAERMIGPGWLALAAGFVFGVLVLALLATIAAALAPRSMSRLRAIVAAAPFRTLGAGFLAQSALVGAAVVLTITLIGVFVAPVALLAAALLGFLGYVVAVYLLGVWAVTRTGALEPDTFPEYALAALVGALLASLLALTPFVGWLVLLALSLTGAGAIATAMLRRDPVRP